MKKPVEFQKSARSPCKTDDFPTGTCTSSIATTFISRALGVSIYTPDPRELPESVLVAERGYWD